MRPSQFLAALLTISNLAAAWPEPLDNAIIHHRRQDTTSSPDKATPGPTKTNLPPKTDGPKSDAPVTGDPSKATNAPSKTITDIKGTGTEVESSEPTESYMTEYAAGDQPGQVVMVSPAPTGPTTFYKIGEPVTFAWNFTALQATPTYIDVLATCPNCPTHTIAANQSAQETQVIWDTDAYQKTAAQKLETKRYTLLIYDASSQVTAAPKPGYLATFRTFSFAMYVPRAPVAWEDFKCAACSDAPSSAERQNFAVLFGMASMTVMSFTWFAGSFGLF